MIRKAILITGAARRIGRAIALEFAVAGYDIALHYHRSEREAKTAKKAIEELGRRCVVLRQDLEDLERLPDLMQRARKELPHLRALVNNASTFHRAGFAKTTPELLTGEITRNFSQAFFLTQAFAKQVKKGVIINLLDVAIHSHRTTHVPYLLSKKLLHEFTLMAAKDLAPAIRVNAVCPGFILPTENAPSRDPKEYAQGLPSRKKPSPQEVAQAALLLAENPSLLGQILYVDGGERLMR